MKKIVCTLLVGMIIVPGLLADDGEYDMPDTGQFNQPINKRGTVKTPAENVRLTVNVQKHDTECKELKNKLKVASANLSTAYQANDPKEIRKQEFNVWYLKEKIAAAEKNKDFAYLIDELKSMYSEYPNSIELKNLVIQTQKEVSNYIQNAKNILSLESKQIQLDEKLAKTQKIGSIIRQKELLKKMQREYNRS